LCDVIIIIYYCVRTILYFVILAHLLQ